MNAPTLLRASMLGTVLAALAPAQAWTDDQLVAACAGFQADQTTARLLQVGTLLGQREVALTAMIARIHGDHREYRLKVDRLLDELSDPRWQVRENAERTLIEVGSRAYTVIQERRDKFAVLEQHIRCRRILDALDAKGTEAETRERLLLRGLVTTALHLDAEPRLARALRSAIGHAESSIADGAVRALGRIGTDDDADALAQTIAYKNGMHRAACLAALGRMNGSKALAHCRTLLLGTPAADGPLAGVTLTRTEAHLLLRTLHARTDPGATALLDEVARGTDPLLAASARTRVPDGVGTTPVQCTMPDRSKVDGKFAGMLGDSLLVRDAFEGLPQAELPFTECDTLDFPGNQPQAIEGVRVFLNQGSLVVGQVLRIDADAVVLRSPRFGELNLPRKEVQGIAFDPTLDRLVGGSNEHDRVRDRDAKSRDGTIVRADATTLVLRQADGTETPIPMATVAGCLFVRPRTVEPDATSYTRVDLVSGERLIGFVGDNNGEALAVAVPQLGAAVIPFAQVLHLETSVGGGAMWGFTLIADYAENRVVEIDDQGRTTLVLEEIYGVWDAECLDSGNLLLTEFAMSRVQEVDRKGNLIWSFEDLKNPYDADRLPNGNTLIADTFGSRVIEVDPKGTIVWSFAKDIRPFDCDRLPNGNTLIADVLKDRVIEVDAKGEVVWEVRGMPFAHDADRLPNGNTLVTLRNKGSVVEVDRDGKVVQELTGLLSPSDADRLPNGNTLVAENQQVREFDRRGNEVWKKEMAWAVEVNRY